jgi:hypothetical protein
MNATSLISGLKKYYQGVSVIAKKEKINPCTMMIDCIWSWIRYGCVLNQYLDGKFYCRKDFERRRILTYRKWKKIIKNYNDPLYTHYLENKIHFNQFFDNLIGREWLQSTKMTKDEFINFVTRHRRIICKPSSDWEGNGIFVLNVIENEQEVIFEKLKKKDLIIEEYVKQHNKMMFGGHSVNTIRVYTVYDKKTGKAYVFKTTLRVGVGDSIVDNSHSGGQAYEVDIETGYVVSPSWSHNSPDLLIHPGTDIFMLGQLIPFWEEVKNLCCKAADKINQVRYIGWDVAIKEDGPILIEGNHDPDLDLVEFVGQYGYYKQIMKHLNE